MKKEKKLKMKKETSNEYFTNNFNTTDKKIKVIFNVNKKMTIKKYYNLYHFFLYHIFPFDYS